MNIGKIRDIVNLNLPDEVTEGYLTAIIAEDKEVIPTLLEMLNNERELKEKLISETNAELSRALVVLQDKNLKYNKKIIADPPWVVSEIIKHYKKWKDHIGCCFKIKELENEIL
jgi:hypothetical protein